VVVAWQAEMVHEGGDSRGWDFFVSYTQADRGWAEWIAWQLEEDGYRVLIQAWDMVEGSNWTHIMQEGVQGAARTVVVLSSAYLAWIDGKKTVYTVMPRLTVLQGGTAHGRFSRPL
jgi:TIR domain